MANIPANLTPRAGNPAAFPCIAGKAPSIGFSHLKATGDITTDAVAYHPDVLLPEAQSQTFVNLYLACVGNATQPQILGKMNCAPNGFVQPCPNLYDCASSASINGTVVGSASVMTPAGNVTASFLAATPNGSDKVLNCMQKNLQPALQAAYQQYPGVVAGAEKSGAKNNAQAGSKKVIGMLVLSSAALWAARFGL